MTANATGKIKGRTIELDQDLGIEDGQEVKVKIEVVHPSKNWGEGLRRCAGAFADEWTEEDDHFFEQLRQQRKIPRRGILEE